MQYKQMIKGYFHSANAHDMDEMLQYFSVKAVVYDEGQEHHGIEAIGEWIEHTNAKYSTQYDLLDISETNNSVTVIALVSGTFPGSPIQLTLRFTIEDGKISQLKCGN